MTEQSSKESRTITGILGFDNGKTNFLQIRRELIAVLTPIYGDLAHVFEEGIPFEYPPIQAINEADLVPVGGVAMTADDIRSLQSHLVKIRITDLNNMAKLKPKLFQDIKNCLSEASVAIVEGHRLYSTHTSIDATAAAAAAATVVEAAAGVAAGGNAAARQLANAALATATARAVALAAGVIVQGAGVTHDPNVLWRIIIETHFTHVDRGGGPALAALDRQNKETAFMLLAQKPTQTIAAFKVEWDRMIAEMRALTIAIPPQDALAIRFMSKLDPARHSKMQASLLNDAAMGRQYPPTVDRAYQIASAWKADPSLRGAAKAGVNEHIFITSDEMVYAACDPVLIVPPVPGPGPRSSRAKPSGKPRMGGAKVLAEHNAAVAARAKSTAAAANKPARVFVPLAEKDCWICKKLGHIAQDCPERVLFTIGEDDEADSGTVYDTANLMFDEEDGLVLMFGDDEIVLDGAAGKSVFKTKGLLHQVRTVRSPGRLRGVDRRGTGLSIDQEGEYADLGTAGYSADSIANILSQGAIKDHGCTISYNDSLEEYTVVSKTRSWVFKRKLLSNGMKSRFYTYNVNEDQGAVMIETVEGNLRRYTVQEAKKADAAVQLMARAGHMSSKAMIDVLKSGVLNCSVTPTDVRNAEAIYGRSVASLKGKTRMHAPIAAVHVLAPRVTQVQQTMHLDLFFVKV